MSCIWKILFRGCTKVWLWLESDNFDYRNRIVLIIVHPSVIICGLKRTDYTNKYTYRTRSRYFLPLRMYIYQKTDFIFAIAKYSIVRFTDFVSYFYTNAHSNKIFIYTGNKIFISIIWYKYYTRLFNNDYQQRGLNSGHGIQSDEFIFLHILPWIYN